MEDQEKPLSLVLFSGTDDKLTAASVLAVGAAVMGLPFRPRRHDAGTGPRRCSTRPTGTRSRWGGFPNSRRKR